MHLARGATGEMRATPVLLGAIVRTSIGNVRPEDRVRLAHHAPNGRIAEKIVLNGEALVGMQNAESVRNGLQGSKAATLPEASSTVADRAPIAKPAHRGSTTTVRRVAVMIAQALRAQPHRVRPNSTGYMKAGVVVPENDLPTGVLTRPGGSARIRAHAEIAMRSKASLSVVHPVATKARVGRHGETRQAELALHAKVDFRRAHVQAGRTVAALFPARVPERDRADRSVEVESLVTSRIGDLPRLPGSQEGMNRQNERTQYVADAAAAEANPPRDRY